LRPSVEIVVADASPLIALARVCDLGLLSTVFARTLVTETVIAERQAGPGDRAERPVITAALERGLLGRIDDPPAGRDWGLGAGEIGAIAAARARGCGLLMDDRAARRIAADLGIPVVGTLGVLLLAKRAGRVETIGPSSPSC
jgi:predicted nucleic acid-binding protein